MKNVLANKPLLWPYRENRKEFKGNEVLITMNGIKKIKLFYDDNKP